MNVEGDLLLKIFLVAGIYYANFELELQDMRFFAYQYVLIRF